MRINRLRFHDKARDWKLEDLEFKKLTLLVGASGVGKTQILRAVMSLNEISSGRSLNGVSWHAEFTTTDNKEYIWKGEFEDRGLSLFFKENYDESKSKGKYKAKIISEELKLNNEVIVSRDVDKIIFNGKETIKLSQQESIVSLLREEELVAPAQQALKLLTFSDQSNSKDGVRFTINSMFNVEKLLRKYDSLSKIQESDLENVIKLYLVSKIDKKIFNKIKRRFTDIFPQISDIKIEPYEDQEDELPSFFKDYPFVQIKEKGVSSWIKQANISSGMYRTLMHLSEINLCTDGTAFLIDEFENSLGVNCLDELTEEILTSRRNIQFILTSHHPYIINNIPYSNWKLVTRKAGVVKTHNASEFGLGNSRHEAFMQLIQLEEFQTGIEQ